MVKDGRRCVSCLSDKTFLDEANNKRLWYHPAEDRKAWICHPCYVRIYFRTYRKRHPSEYKSYQQAYHKTYYDSKPKKRKYRYHNKDVGTKRLLASNRYLRRELLKVERELAYVEVLRQRLQPRTQGVY